jgi:hypothetical protein
VVEDGRFAAALTEPNIVSISDMGAETSERLTFKDAVVKTSIGVCGLLSSTAPQG